MGVERIVAAVLDEGGRNQTDAHTLGEQRNQLGCDQWRSQNVDLAESESILNRVGLRQFLPQLYGSFLPARRKRSNIMRKIEQARKEQIQLRITFKLRRKVGEQGPLFQCRYQALQANGMSQSQKIQPAHAEGKTRAEPGGSSGRIQRPGV